MDNTHIKSFMESPEVYKRIFNYIEVKIEKNKAVVNRNYEKAAEARDKERELLDEISKLYHYQFSSVTNYMLLEKDIKEYFKIMGVDIDSQNLREELRQFKIDKLFEINPPFNP